MTLHDTGSHPSTAAVEVLGVRVHSMEKTAAVKRLIEAAQAGVRGYVCFAEAHMMVESHRDPSFKAAINGSLFTMIDGAPIRWLAAHFGPGVPETVDGPGVTPKLLAACAREGLAIGFYGSTQETLDALVARVKDSYPGLRIVYTCSPPFRPLTPAEDERCVREVTDSGAQLLLVGLGCPKQERWMAEHRDRIPCLMLGVGGVFEFLAGRRKMAPPLLQRAGLTWLYRVVQEPRRLARRILRDLPQFLLLAVREVIMRPRLHSNIEAQEAGTAGSHAPECPRV